MAKRTPKTVTLFDGRDDLSMGDASGDSNLDLQPYSGFQKLHSVQARSLLIESLVEQLCKLLEKDPHKQQRLFLSICQNLTKLKFLAPDFLQDESMIVRAKFKDLMKNFITLSVNNCEVPNTNAMLPRDFSSLLSGTSTLELSSLLNGEITFHNSRYKLDFKEEEIIASGGFGVVCKAWRKVDQQYYAVKKIPFKFMQDPLLNKVLREVEVLAQNSHPNVVGYKTAWIEASSEYDPTLDNINSGSESESKEYQPSEKNGRPNISMEEHTQDDDDDFVIFQSETSTELHRESFCTTSINTHEMLHHKFQRSFSSGVVITECNSNVSLEVDELEQHSTTKSSSDPSKTDVVRPVCRRSSSTDMPLVICRNSNNTVLGCRGILYVQMELCQESLRHWLDRRVASYNDVDASQSMSILRQIMKGVEYLHSKGIIHRDLKPQNILFSDNCVKIGDFGLATLCCRQGEDDEPEKVFCPWSNHTQGVGTSPYAAPEQRQGNQYDSKVDMYSIGVILLELLYPFQTSMELVMCLESICRHGRLPKQILDEHPEAANMIIMLTKTKPKLRPSAFDVLNSELFLSKSQIIENLKLQLLEKDKVIEAKDKLIMDLKSRLKCADID